MQKKAGKSRVKRRKVTIQSEEEDEEDEDEPDREARSFH